VLSLASALSISAYSSAGGGEFGLFDDCWGGKDEFLADALSNT